MTKTITLDRVREVLAEVVAERPDHVQDVCAYLSAGRFDDNNPRVSKQGEPYTYEVVCIAAQVFHRIDPEINLELRAKNAGSISRPAYDEERSPAREILERHGFTDDALRYLSIAQFQADNMRPWAKAREAAEAEVTP